jgi:hypothetical protein
LFRFLTIVCALWPVSLQVSSLLAQTSQVPYDSDAGPSFHLRTYSYVYPNGYQSIHDVDFENLKVTFGNDENGRPMLTQLRKGGWRVDGPFGSYNSICLQGVHFLDSAETGRQYALTVFEEDDMGAHSTTYGLAELFELTDKHLRVSQLIDWDLDYGGPYGPLDDFDEMAKTLTIRTLHYRPGDYYRRASAVDVVTYGWDGRVFSEAAIRTELSDYGKEKRKAPPPKRTPVP